MKKLASFLVLMCVSLSAMASWSSVRNSDGVNIWYTFYAYVAHVSYNGDYADHFNEYGGDIVIPSTIWNLSTAKRYEVTGITTGAFQYCDALTSVTIPESVTWIGANAFYGCDALTSINVDLNNNYYTSVDGVLFNKDMTTLIRYPAGKDASSYAIPEGVTTIAEYAFCDCKNLTRITLPSSLTTIGDHAFCNCDNLTRITLPSSLTTIADYAFYDCYSLTSITLPESLTSIGDYAFYDCYSLTSITLPENLTTIGENAFMDCSALTKVNYNGTIADWCGISFGNVYSNPMYCNGHYYFDGVEVTDVVIPSGVTTINDFAFYSCDSLTSITLPESLTSIGEKAFYDCDNLWVVNNKSNLTITAGSEGNGYVARYAKIVNDGVVDGEVKTVGDYYFYVAGDTIKLIAYTGGESSITLPADYEGLSYDVADNSFANRYLKSITIPDGVTSIGASAFYECYALTSVTLPESLTSIGKNAFAYCDALTKVNYNGTIVDWCGISFGNACSNPIYYANNLYIDGVEVTDVVIPSGVTTINDFAFYNYENITSVTLPEGLTSIGNSAFAYCDALTSITIPESLTSIGGGAFYNCSALTSITLPEGVTSIGDYAFYGCENLRGIINKSDLTITAGSSDNGYVAYYAKNVYTDGEEVVGDYIFYANEDTIELIAYIGNETSITLPSDYEGNSYDIADKVFYDCDDLTSVTIPEGVTQIGENVFYSCSALTSITLPENLTTIGENAFMDCSALTKVNYNGTIADWCGISFGNAYSNPMYCTGHYSFDGVEVTDVVISSGVTTINSFAFYNCYALTSITLPESLTSIGNYAFAYCDALTSITSNNTTPPTVGGKNAFYGIDTTIPIYVPKSSVEVYKSAEYWKDFTNIVGAYFVDVTAENGTVEGAGAYEENAEATLTATPAEGYKFVQWSDGVTDNPRTVVVVSDTTFTAEFEIDDTPISDIQTSDVNVRLIGNRVAVEGADDYTVYSISGQNLGKVESVERGIYIVVVNGKSFKVVAK